MKTKLPDGTVLVAGYVPKDAEKADAEKAPWKFSVKVGDLPLAEGEEKPKASWCNCASWHDSAGTIRKGDTVLAWGKLASREHEGKTYWTLNCDGFIFANKVFGQADAIQTTASQLPSDLSQFEEIIGDGDLPF